jgi:hypothetical protein
MRKMGRATDPTSNEGQTQRVTFSPAMHCNWTSEMFGADGLQASNERPHDTADDLVLHGEDCLFRTSKRSAHTERWLSISLEL